MRLVLIDYGIGNLRSVNKALKAVGADVIQTGDSAAILAADKVVLPGVGAFRDGMEGLAARGLFPVLEALHQSGTPLLEICVGIQLLFTTGYENGAWEGLDFISGVVKPFPLGERKVPQTGWNQLEQLSASPLFQGVPIGSYVCFNHGFCCVPKFPQTTIAHTYYGFSYASAIQQDSLYGAEKSQAMGLAILRNFGEVCT